MTIGMASFVEIVKFVSKNFCDFGLVATVT